MVAKSSAEETAVNTGEGVVIHKNEPYTDDNNPYGLPPGGQYTHKTLHFASRLPRWALSILPTTAMSLTERSWNAYPRCVTQYTNEYLGDSLHLTVTSAHAADRGEQSNATGLGPEDLAVRQVDYINIACGSDADAAAVRAFVPGSSGGGRLGRKDTANVAAVSGRGPLGARWFAEGTGGGVCMCAYKVRGGEWTSGSWGWGAYSVGCGGDRGRVGTGVEFAGDQLSLWVARALEMESAACAIGCARRSVNVDGLVVFSFGLFELERWSSCGSRCLVCRPVPRHGVMPMAFVPCLQPTTSGCGAGWTSGGVCL